jgi:hypothetical protein
MGVGVSLLDLILGKDFHFLFLRLQIQQFLLELPSLVSGHFMEKNIGQLFFLDFLLFKYKGQFIFCP